MESSSFHYLPQGPWFFAVLALVLAGLVALVQFGLLSYAYDKIGISRSAAWSLLLASLVGSMINIPLAELPGKKTVVWQRAIDRWGVPHAFPVIQEFEGTQLAINVGGAVIPIALSIYLIAKNQIYFEALIGVSAVAAVVHALATPVPHMGIAVPIFIPPVISALIAIILTREYAAPLAYVSGCVGTLVGADVMNLAKLGEIGASIASIGGAGTFDGVFLTGILAVLLAARPGHSPRAQGEVGQGSV